MYKAEHHKGWIWEYNLLLPACQHHDKIPKIPPETYTIIYMGTLFYFSSPTLQTYTLKGLAYTTLASKPTLEHAQTYTMKPTHLH